MISSACMAIYRMPALSRRAVEALHIEHLLEPIVPIDLCLLSVKESAPSFPATSCCTPVFMTSLSLPDPGISTMSNPPPPPPFVQISGNTSIPSNHDGSSISQSRILVIPATVALRWMPSFSSTYGPGTSEVALQSGWPVNSGYSLDSPDLGSSTLLGLPEKPINFRQCARQVR